MRDRRIAAGNRWAMVLGALLAVLAIDQLSKRWALERLAPEAVGAPGEVIEVLGPLQFNLAFNTGASFSMGSGSGALIGVIAVVIVVVLAVVARKVDSKVQLVLIGIVMGGALGNIVDRLTRVGEVNPFTGEVAEGFMSGAVVDFIDVQFWPIWNVADMAVVVGGILLAVIGAFAPVPEEEQTQHADAAAPAPSDAAVDPRGPVEPDESDAGAGPSGEAAGTEAAGNGDDPAR